MVASTKKKHPVRRILLILLGVLLVFIIGYFATVPFFDALDHNRFEKLDEQAKQIHADLVAANPNEAWTYEASCSVVYAGAWPTDDHICKTESTLMVEIDSVDDITSMHGLYLDTLEKEASLTSASELMTYPSGEFSKSLVISAAEKNYKLNGVKCIYLFQVAQTDENSVGSNDAVGTKIINDTGRALVTFSCRDDARKAWFPINNS